LEALLGKLRGPPAEGGDVSELSPILLIDDDPRRLEATLQVLADLRLANRIEVTRSEAEARVAVERHRPALVVVSIGRDSSGAAGLLADLRREARGPAVLALAPAVSVRELAEMTPALEVAAEPLTREALLEAVENLGLAWGIVGSAAPRGAYVPGETASR
jgi:DNA-binding NtrC family response regulator